MVKMQRQEAALGSVCKSLNLKKERKKSGWIGEWVVRMEGSGKRR